MDRSKNKPASVSIVLPAKNEEKGLAELLPKLIRLYPKAEINVVNDSSTDATVRTCQLHGVKTVNHLYSMGNGAAVKSGARAATGNILIFMDADGQHNAEDIQRLLDKLDENYDMVVGAREAGHKPIGGGSGHHGG